ncbi:MULTISPECIES: response regulator transcription factor [Variovorax]|uniref:response regulator n=1 Tax=Variovorax TaxID=34072 RepID=UPI0009EF43C6|nr:response regulator transcription factor [Variovorax boronicumulans]GER16063.1 DNA-binding response regulator [Variovorax boronicumulans]
MPLTATQVAVVEDDSGMRERIARVIGADPALALAFSASNAVDILNWLTDNPVDVLLVDLGLPDHPGLQVIRQCRRMQPACAVMVLTIFGDETHMVQAFEAGARGYLLKDGTEADLAAHLRHLGTGGSPLPPGIARQLLRRWQASDGAPGHLSSREAEVLDRVSRGFTYAEIGAQMGVSASTVQTHIRNIYGKLDAPPPSEAVLATRPPGRLS